MVNVRWVLLGSKFVSTKRKKKQKTFLQKKKTKKQNKNIYTKYFEVFWLCRNAFLHTTKKLQYPLPRLIPPTITP
jgi:hypothetical protein